MFSFTVTFTTLFVTLPANIGGSTAGPANTIAESPNGAPFGINIGTTWNNNVAWVDGDSQCNNVVTAPLKTNPCSREFSINGQSGFTLEGCGTNTVWINQNHNFYANCGALKEKEQCGVKTSYHCL